MVSPPLKPIAQHFGARLLPAWLEAMPDLIVPGLSAGGAPLTFDKALITPYGSDTPTPEFPSKDAEVVPDLVELEVAVPRLTPTLG